MWSRKPALSWLDRLRSSKGIPVTTDLNLEQFLNQNPNSSSDSVSWLDRLWFSKGIPVTTDLNLEQFLNQNPNSSSDSVSIPKQIQPKSKSKPGQESEQLDKEPEWFNPMSSVPAELSVMEDKSNKSHQFIQKKRSRKQINPKICVLSSSIASVDGAGVDGGAVGVRGGGGVGVMSPSSGDNSVLDEEEDEGCSWLDCVVIDTSNVEWKFENLVTRKGNVWKVREKKLVLKKILPMKKKRKTKKIDNDDDDDYDIKDEKKKKKKKKKKNKKTKQKASLVRSTSISNKEDDDQCPVLPFEGSPVNNNQISIRRAHPNLDQAPTKRCKFLSLSANLGKKRFAPYL